MTIIKTLKLMPSILALICISLAFMSKAQSVEEIEKQVADRERAFAQTMADRDFEKFKTFLDENAVFLGGKSVMRGKKQIAEKWQRYFEKEQAPFAWKPERVAVIGGGDIALSTGPVWNPDGRVHSYYTSTWRKDSSGEWKVILDKGQKYCPPEHKATN